MVYVSIMILLYGCRAHTKHCGMPYVARVCVCDLFVLYIFLLFLLFKLVLSLCCGGICYPIPQSLLSSCVSHTHVVCFCLTLKCLSLYLHKKQLFFFFKCALLCLLLGDVIKYFLCCGCKSVFVNVVHIQE